MTDDSRRRIDDRAISRRTALLGLLGGAAGSTVGYERLLGADEPALAETDLELSADDVTIDAACGRVSDLSVSGESAVDLEYENMPLDLVDGFELTLEANPHVVDREDHEGWSEPHDEKPDDLENVLDGMDGDGTKDDPYQITDDYELQAIKANDDSLDAHYELANNIDASKTDGWNGGFDPIWDLEAEVGFTGTIEGNGHTICGLTIESDEQGVGLIGGNAGTVTDLALVGCEITVTGGNDAVAVGTLAGANSGDVENVAVVDVTIDVDDPVDDLVAVGGCIGVNDGDVTTSYATGHLEVTTEADCIVGGFVGANLTTAIDGEEGEDEMVGTITESYSDTQICLTLEDTGSSGIVAGFAALNTGTITDAYAKGAFTVTCEEGLFTEADAVAGGFVGSNFLEEDDGIDIPLIGLLLDVLVAVVGALVTLVGALFGLIDDDREPVEDIGGGIERSYAAIEDIEADELDEEEEIAGFAVGNEGDEEDGDISNSYWDEDVLDMDIQGVGGEDDNNDGDADVTGLDTTEMQGIEAEDNMSELDFEDIWMTIEEPEDDYPQLQENSESPEEKSGDKVGFDPIFKTEPIDIPGSPPSDHIEDVSLSDLLDEDVSLTLENHDAIDGGEDDGTAYRQFEPYRAVERETKIDFKLVLEHEDEDVDIEATAETTESTERATVTVRIPDHTDE